ncbi:hypothetical protein HPP92_013599 [Vanilla planifolia]|uniref:Uncharacterized protein n=1 Tax=Vanilla planifolia TaxID=51239 RepID=A0A835QS09_VANPL|nr:hypothetical protein HPP92_013599 [Vanilla planifolia]
MSGFAAFLTPAEAEAMPSILAESPPTTSTSPTPAFLSRPSSGVAAVCCLPPLPLPVPIIGAQVFAHKGTMASLDELGHGTHVSGMAAGTPDKNANLLGQAQGTATGMAPPAHIASYKVCSPSSCTDSNSIKGFDQAITYGVDLVQISLGKPNVEYHSSGIVFGSYAALRQGILTVNSAGNDGPTESILDNDVPWILHVGAAIIHRRIVLCGVGRNTVISKAKIVKKAEGAGIVWLNSPLHGNILIAAPYDIPAVLVSYNDAMKILDYFSIDKKPTGTISFRGTDMRNGGILKPDVIAPGVNILSAYNLQMGPKNTKKKSDASNSRKPANIFAIGAGHIDPSAANDPGLLYNASAEDYIPYLFSLKGYTSKEVKIIVNRPINCKEKKAADELNYPAIQVYLGATGAPMKTVKRTVTNFGEANYTYTATVVEPSRVKVEAKPKTLQFKSIGEEQSFVVELNLTAKKASEKDKVMEGRLKWVSGKREVSSPIVVVT